MKSIILSEKLEMPNSIHKTKASWIRMSAGQEIILVSNETIAGTIKVASSSSLVEVVAMEATPRTSTTQ